MIYALSVGTNIDHANAIAQAKLALASLGDCTYSAIFELPDRRGHGPMYWNVAVLLDSPMQDPTQLTAQLQHIEQACGRVRPSAHVRMDLDLIAYGDTPDTLTVVRARQPLPLDVTVPLLTLWPQCPTEFA